MNGDDKIVIADTSNEGIYEFTIHAGKNFIVLEGETFTGTLNLNVSQNSVSDDIATDFGRAQDIRETSDLPGLDWNGKETENEKLSWFNSHICKTAEKSGKNDIDQETGKLIQTCPGVKCSGWYAYVKQAYGRMFVYDIPAEGDRKINLITYEEQQFKWAYENQIWFVA